MHPKAQLEAVQKRAEQYTTDAAVGDNPAHPSHPRYRQKVPAEHLASIYADVFATSMLDGFWCAHFKGCQARAAQGNRDGSYQPGKCKKYSPVRLLNASSCVRVCGCVRMDVCVGERERRLQSVAKVSVPHSNVGDGITFVAGCREG